MDRIESSKSPAGSRAKIAFISAQWHADVVEQCRKGFLAELEKLGQAHLGVDSFTVPGAYDIPLMAQKLCQLGNYEAIVASALVVDGGIYRHDFVSTAVIDGMMRVQLDLGVPIISAVLTPHHYHENAAHEDFFKEHFVLKGEEAARATASIIDNMRMLDGREAAAA